MGAFLWLRFFLLVVLASCLYAASITDAETREVDPIENNPDFTESGLEIHGGDMLYPEDLLTDETRQAIDPNYYRRPGDPQCLRWDNAVLLYHRNSTSMSDSTFSMLQKAMDLWSLVSCIRFRPVNLNSQDPFVKFTDTYGGCYAHVGCICWIPGYNELNLGRGCAYSVGTPAHELGHALGIYHQQSRYDRDSYVKVQMQNVQSGRDNNFEKKTTANTDNFDVEYDYCSVMHYSKYAFSSNGQPTIVHIDPKNNMDFGQRNGLSWGDIKLANRMYDCAKNCDKTKLSCDAKCFLNERCKCSCPRNQPRSTCNAYTSSNLPLEVEPKTTGATTTTTTTTTPKPKEDCSILLEVGNEKLTWNFATNNSNQKRMECTVTVKSKSGGNVNIKVTKASFSPGKARRGKNKGKCLGSYFEYDSPKKTFCGKISKKNQISLTGSMVEFYLFMSGDRKKVMFSLSVTPA